MSVLDKISMGDQSVEEKIMVWMSDKWASTSDIYSALNNNIKAEKLHSALASLMRSGKIEAKDIHNQSGVGGRTKTVFRLVR